MGQAQLYWIANFIWGIAADVLGEPRPLRTLDQIPADILAQEKETEGLLAEIIGGEGRHERETRKGQSCAGRRPLGRWSGKSAVTDRTSWMRAPVTARRRSQTRRLSLCCLGDWDGATSRRSGRPKMARSGGLHSARHCVG